jgi:hydroxypyruvate isomerase
MLFYREEHTMPKLAANLSMLFSEVAFTQRFAAAAGAGFKAVEYLFPYDIPVAEIKSLLESNGLTQVLFNLPGGDWVAGERGIGCHPGRTEEFREGVARAIDYAVTLGVPRVNCLAGIIADGVSAELAEKTFIANLKYAASELQKAGIGLVIEAINTRDIPGFFLSNTTQGLAIIDKVGSDNLKLQYDIYHMQIMEGDICPTLQAHLDAIGHIQLADTPGRHEPGTGELNYHFILRFLDDLGYQGWIGCEYKPETTTEAGLGWLTKYQMI